MLSSNLSLSALLRTILLILPLLSPTTATPSSDLCTQNLLYSPFTPWFKAWPNVTSGPGANVQNMACWWYADCCFSLSPDTRKQQYAATSLVMGLIPLILKDIAWPHRRIAFIPRPQPWYIEILVRALGLNPTVTKNTITEGRTFKTGLLSHAVFAILVIQLLATYAALVITELYSKRSSLGCPVPTFLTLWFIVALVPSALEVGASRFRRRNEAPAPTPLTTESPSEQNEEGIASDNVRKIGLTVTVSESIPGGQEIWFVQFFWAIYYTAGTLVFSSIMLVTVVELVVWVVTTCAVTAASKMLGYKLCGYWGCGIK